MKDVLHNLKKNKKIIDILFLLCITLIIAIPLYSKKFNIYYGEGSQNLVWAYNTYKSIIQNGNIKIISNFVNGYGYSLNLFTPYLSILCLILFAVITKSYIIGYKLLLFLIIFLAGISIYKLIKEITEKRFMALIAGCVYITSPYLFNSIFIDLSISNAITFIFVPYVFLGLYNLFNTEKKTLLFSNRIFTV